MTYYLLFYKIMQPSLYSGSCPVVTFSVNSIQVAKKMKKTHKIIFYD